MDRGRRRSCPETWVLGVFQPKLGNVGAWIGIHQLVLLGHELHFLSAICSTCALKGLSLSCCQASDLVVVDPAEVLVSEPRLVFHLREPICHWSFAWSGTRGANRLRRDSSRTGSCSWRWSRPTDRSPCARPLAKIKRFVSDFGTYSIKVRLRPSVVEVQDGAVGRGWIREGAPCLLSHWRH